MPANYFLDTLFQTGRESLFSAKSLLSPERAFLTPVRSLRSRTAGRRR